MSSAGDIGARGERVAMEYLINEGFTILHTNWRSGRYELDIVAQRHGAIHFVEVKCRKANGLTTPEDAITRAKFNSLRHAAAAYLTMYRIDSESQFDLIAVEHDGAQYSVRYIPQAMTMSW